MADDTPTKPSKKGSSEPAVHYDGAKAKAKSKAVVHADAEDGHAGDAATASLAPANRTRLLRCACCGLAALAALAAVVILVLSLTVLRVRDPDLTMDSVTVERFHVGFAAVPDGRPPLRINATLAAWIMIRNPNYASMWFGASTTEIFLDGVPGRVGLGSAPPGEASARGASQVRGGMDVFVDRVAPAVVGEVLFGRGEVRLTSRTAMDGRVSVLGGIYGRRTVRVAMRCHVVLHVSAVVVVAGFPSCVAEFGR
ncbi:unnamed protein product [Triticum turgidum subsp. durum]|uniref:Late embryogenesis abundant protein LEA-2 subgroup domain-containing protein n=1 Tax=Triticum turgidum subsp. durum TaxID=4567 RepID=A0A9R0R7G0_TRITD|nr:unnamed protein product [Triticum turgidum subsp. durum]